MLSTLEICYETRVNRRNEIICYVFLFLAIPTKQIVHSMSSTNPIEKNLLVTDSSSCASVNEQCLSSASSSLSYHTARAGDSSSSSVSMTSYETPTPHLDDETLSSHSSLSDLSHAETLEPSVEGK